MSLKSSAQVMEWPPIFIFEPTLDNYKVLFDILLLDLLIMEL